MAGSGHESFGAIVRRERERLDIGLREMAKMIGVSSTYLSQVERDKFAPPTEDRVRKIAEIIHYNPDELLALAGRVSSDLNEIIRRQPRDMASFLRTVDGLSAQQRTKILRDVDKVKRK